MHGPRLESFEARSLFFTAPDSKCLRCHMRIGEYLVRKVGTSTPKSSCDHDIAFPVCIFIGLRSFTPYPPNLARGNISGNIGRNATQELH